MHKFGVDVVPNRFIVHNNNLTNLTRGLTERVFYVPGKEGLEPPPSPQQGIFRERLGYYRSGLLGLGVRTTPVSLDEFPLLYTGRKRTIYQQAVDSLASRPIHRRDGIVKTFVKAEKVRVTNDKPDPAPRVIQPRDPRYNAVVGRYLKKMEGVLCGLIKRFHDDTVGGQRLPVVMKGLDAVDTANVIVRKWSKYRNPVAIGLDASRFDQHVSADALEWEHSVYVGLTATGKEELARLLRWQTTNHGRAYLPEAKVSYTRRGGRMSGDMNTGMGNCLLMCAMVHAYLRHTQVRGSLCNNGDDCVVIMERCDASRFRSGLAKWFHEMGFTMKVEDTVDVLEQIEFCQSRPVFDGEQWVMVRRDAMAKDLTSILDLTRGVDKWAHAVGTGGLALAGGIPVYDALYRRLRYLGSPGNVQDHTWCADSGFFRLVNATKEEHNRTSKSISAHARYSYWLAFGVTPDEQVALERDLACLTLG